MTNKEEDYKDNPGCWNCPYFINKLVSAHFVAKMRRKGMNLIIQIHVRDRTNKACNPS